MGICYCKFGDFIDRILRLCKALEEITKCLRFLFHLDLSHPLILSKLVSPLIWYVHMAANWNNNFFKALQLKDKFHDFFLNLNSNCFLHWEILVKQSIVTKLSTNFHFANSTWFSAEIAKSPKTFLSPISQFQTNSLLCSSYVFASCSRMKLRVS